MNDLRQLMHSTGDSLRPDTIGLAATARARGRVVRRRHAGAVWGSAAGAAAVIAAGALLASGPLGPGRTADPGSGQAADADVRALDPTLAVLADAALNTPGSLTAERRGGVIVRLPRGRSRAALAQQLGDALLTTAPGRLGDVRISAAPPRPFADPVALSTLHVMPGARGPGRSAALLVGTSSFGADPDDEQGRLSQCSAALRDCRITTLPDGSLLRTFRVIGDESGILPGWAAERLVGRHLVTVYELDRSRPGKADRLPVFAPVRLGRIAAQIDPTHG